MRLRCPSRAPEIARFPRQEKAMLHCDLRVRWKVASDLRFWAAISEPKTPSFCGISGDLAPSTRKSLAIAIVRFWCAKTQKIREENNGGRCPSPSAWGPPVNHSCAFPCDLGSCLRIGASCLRYCKGICTGQVYCLSLCPVWIAAKKSGQSDGTNPFGVHASCSLFSCYCVMGPVPLVGRPLASRYQGPS